MAKVKLKTSDTRGIKKRIVKRVREECGIEWKTAYKAYETLLSAIIDEVIAGNRVVLRGLGTIYTNRTPERKGGIVYGIIPPHLRVGFRVSAKLKEQVKKYDKENR